MEKAMCRTCRAPVVWLPTINGRSMPVDAATYTPGDQQYDRRRHQSHFASCTSFSRRPVCQNPLCSSAQNTAAHDFVDLCSTCWNVVSHTVRLEVIEEHRAAPGSKAHRRAQKMAIRQAAESSDAICPQGVGTYVGEISTEELGENNCRCTARRVVAAYNACGGIPVTALEANGISQLFEAARALLTVAVDSDEALTLRAEVARILRLLEPDE